MRFLVAIRAAIAADQHAQMAHSPAVLTAYSSLRAALAGQGTFDPKVGLHSLSRVQPTPVTVT